MWLQYLKKHDMVLPSVSSLGCESSNKTDSKHEGKENVNNNKDIKKEKECKENKMIFDKEAMKDQALDKVNELENKVDRMKEQVQLKVLDPVCINRNISSIKVEHEIQADSKTKGILHSKLFNSGQESFFSSMCSIPQACLGRPVKQSLQLTIIKYKPRLFVIGDLAMDSLSVHLKESKGLSVHFEDIVYVDSGALSKKAGNEIVDNVLSHDNPPTENDIIVLGSISGSVLKSKDGRQLSYYLDKGKLHLDDQAVLISNEEFQEVFDLLHLMATRLICSIGSRGKVVIVPVLPRFFDRCCRDYTHFYGPGPALVSSLREWAIFMSRFKPNCVTGQILTVSLDKVFGSRLWQGVYTHSDGVNLNRGGLQLLSAAVCAAALNSDAGVVVEPASIPAGVSVSQWRQQFRMNNPDLERISVPNHLRVAKFMPDETSPPSPSCDKRKDRIPRGYGARRDTYQQGRTGHKGQGVSASRAGHRGHNRHRGGKHFSSKYAPGYGYGYYPY